MVPGGEFMGPRPFGRGMPPRAAPAKPAPVPAPEPERGQAVWLKRLTGADRETFSRWQVAGTSLGIPYVLDNGSVGYLFGDTFSTQWPEGPPMPNNWRSPIMLRSNAHPATSGGVVFDSAARVTGDGPALELMHNGHHGPGIDGLPEVTVIPTDGISFHETRRQVIAYMSIEAWTPGTQGPQWKSRYAGLAYSDNGNDFTRTPLKWFNDQYNASPFQMWSMQRDGEWVYIYSVRSGRQPGPMMLRRVRWDRILFPHEYQGWGWAGNSRGWGRPCAPILTGHLGEPSVRKLVDGTWAMAYLNGATGCIVTRTADGPDRPWSPERVQVDSDQEPGLHGGFIHPWSTSSPNGLHLFVSKWTRASGKSTAYHVSQYMGSL